MAVTKNNFFILYDPQQEAEIDDQISQTEETFHSINQKRAQVFGDQGKSLYKKLLPYAQKTSLPPEQLKRFVLDMIKESEFDFATLYSEQKELDKEFKNLKTLLSRHPIKLVYDDKIKYLMHLIASKEGYKLGLQNDGRFINSHCFHYNYENEQDEIAPEDINILIQEFEDHRRYQNMISKSVSKYERISDKESAIIKERIYKNHFINFGTLPSFTHKPSRGVRGNGCILLEVINNFFGYEVTKESMYYYRTKANKLTHTYVRNNWLW